MGGCGCDCVGVEGSEWVVVLIAAVQYVCVGGECVWVGVIVWVGVSVIAWVWV